MEASGDYAPCVAVVGPTAAGKSHLALLLAEQFGGEIVNFDSVQVYRGFDIGSAKIRPHEMRGIRHHLIDHVDPAHPYSAGEFAQEARGLLGHLREREVLPVLVGGTGLYLEALLRGLFRGPRRNAHLRTRLERSAERNALGHLWGILQRLDAKAADAIHPNDKPKLIRAIEVTLDGTAPVTDQWTAPRERLEGFRTLLIGLQPPRQALVDRIESRTRAMFASGLVEETAGLLESGVPQSARAFGALGYAQCVRHLNGTITLAEAIETTTVETRQYAKRQMTWFRNRAPETVWWNGFGDTPEAGAFAVDTCRKHCGWNPRDGR